MYVIFDLETTGFSREKHEIIEIAAAILTPSGAAMDDTTFQSYVKPTNSISATISSIRGITNNDVAELPSFAEVESSFLEFINEKVDEHELENGNQIHHIILVAHNGKRFDVPFFSRNGKAWNQ